MWVGRQGRRQTLSLWSVCSTLGFSVMNDLQRYFEDNRGRLIDKYTHYFDIYERYFSRFRNTEVHFVEIGIFQGGSLQMWKHYFGPKARIYGVDINPECKKFEEDQISVFIGDQSDKTFLRQLTQRIPRMDIVLDDGGHFMDQQIASFEVLYPALAVEGVYLCEDLHTSYQKPYGGGFRGRGTFIEYSKYFIDYLHTHYSAELQGPAIREFAAQTFGVHYYDSMIVLEKRAMKPPERRQTGIASFPMSQPSGWGEKLKARLPQLRNILKHKLGFRPYHRRSDV